MGGRPVCGALPAKGPPPLPASEASPIALSKLVAAGVLQPPHCAALPAERFGGTGRQPQAGAGACLQIVRVVEEGAQRPGVDGRAKGAVVVVGRHAAPPHATAVLVGGGLLVVAGAAATSVCVG